MKPQDLHVQTAHSFHVRHEVAPHFYNKLQYHPEIELVFIIKGTGQLIIGNTVHYFSGEDV